MAARDVTQDLGLAGIGDICVPGRRSPLRPWALPGRHQQRGRPGMFTFTFIDSNGWQDLGVVNILINDALNGNGACYLAYSRPLNTLYLVNDAGNGLLPGFMVNPAGMLGNAANVQSSVRALRSAEAAIP